MEELDTVVLTADIPEQGLSEGDIGTIMLVYPSGEDYEVEFNLTGGTQVINATVPGSILRLARPDEFERAQRLG